MSSIIGEPGEKRFLLGNEAIARGLIEAGVGFSAGYPGTPASEIIDTLLQAKHIGKFEYYVEISTNEKVAYEAAFSACLAGVRSFTAAKHVGINVAADAIATSAYIGTNAGFAFVSADDPNCWSSQNEQDNRWYARIFGLVMIEPSTPMEAKEMTKIAYEISEKVRLPVIIRTTTRVAHMRGLVELGEIPSTIKTKGKFERDISRYVVVPANARRNHKLLLDRIETAEKISEESKLNFITSTSGALKKKLGIITSGVSYLYVIEAAEKLGVGVDILKLGFTYPLPRRKIVDFLSNKDAVLIVEEVDGILEKEIKAIAHENDLRIPIHGKNLIPKLYELNTAIVEGAIAKILGLPYSPYSVQIKAPDIPSRPPILCPGCPHRATYFALKMALIREKIKPEDVIYTTDIGCYTLGINPPYQMGDLLLCMGSSIGTLNGLAETTDQLIIALIGDSTFYHAGIPALINIVFNKHRAFVIVLDNRITAMTGFQPSPSTGLTGMLERTKVVPIEDIARAIGIDYVSVIDPVLNINDAIEKLQESIRQYRIGKTVTIISRSPCALYNLRVQGYTGKGGVYNIDSGICINCGVCYKQFNCPAIQFDPEQNKPFIRSDICTGCGVCMDICPVKAIKRADKSV
ncbi:MAG: indolepyruvate ferredoxin oxidoreductase subunit alpha [Crenarchaeota archaeon]|nr:indolepyruvate ferredoxin oxidoreductase subunit alpha [Thermoproteota archaeon]MCR8454727.1 indolepyruvate ferredoxin oxidoreductase subunit alpha [Thermoproteota archaeon]MCR8487491.1 indolepyruvate ferredoxin oxidoreductase subunit alpha [Thermoproteota archaeon]MCR8501303.1 indolepyruvate ferredoxin oxidoreductase subunit alpha [Thermoproteota archaeon]